MINTNRSLNFVYKKGEGVGVYLIKHLDIGVELASIHDVIEDDNQTEHCWGLIGQLFTSEGVFDYENEEYVRVL